MWQGLKEKHDWYNYVATWALSMGDGPGNSNTSQLFPVKTSLLNLVHHNLPPVCQTTQAISFNQEA